MVPFKWRCLALLLLATSTFRSPHFTSSEATVALRSSPSEPNESFPKTSDIHEFLDNFFKDINPDFEVQPASTEPPIDDDDDERPSRGWCRYLLTELDGWYAKQTLIDLDVALGELELCIEYISGLQSTQPDDASLAQMQTKLLNYREIVRPYVLSGQIHAQPTYPLISLPQEVLQSQEPSRDWCQVVVDELYNRYMGSRIIEQPEVIMAQLQSCIEFISAEQSANPEDASLAQMHSLLLFFRDNVQQLLPQEQVQLSPAQPEPILNWFKPSQRLLKWLQKPIEQIGDAIEAELQVHCDDLINLLEGNLPSKKLRVDQMWNIPLDSFNRRLLQCSGYYTKQDDEVKHAIIQNAREQTYRNLAEAVKTEGLQRWKAPSPALQAWLQEPGKQTIKSVLQVRCNELVIFCRAIFGAKQQSPSVQKEWNIPLESFMERLRQCEVYFKGLGDSDKRATINNAYGRTFRRIAYEQQKRRQQNADPVEPNVHGEGSRRKQPRY